MEKSWCIFLCKNVMTFPTTQYLLLNNIPYVCIPCFIFLSVDKHVGPVYCYDWCFFECSHTFLCVHKFPFWGSICHWVELLSHMVFLHLRNCCAIFPKWLYDFKSPLETWEKSSCSTFAVVCLWLKPPWLPWTGFSVWLLIF